MPGAVGGSVDSEPTLFVPVVFAAKRSPVAGVGSSVSRVFEQVVGLTVAAWNGAARPYTPRGL